MDQRLCKYCRQHNGWPTQESLAGIPDWWADSSLYFQYIQTEN